MIGTSLLPVGADIVATTQPLATVLLRVMCVMWNVRDLALYRYYHNYNFHTLNTESDHFKRK